MESRSNVSSKATSALCSASLASSVQIHMYGLQEAIKHERSKKKELEKVIGKFAKGEELLGDSIQDLPELTRENLEKQGYAEVLPLRPRVRKRGARSPKLEPVPDPYSRSACKKPPVPKAVVRHTGGFSRKKVHKSEEWLESQRKQSNELRFLLRSTWC
eukprot:TRINITY_DN5303_c1_g1_i1.p1 TRINITY_DN5303_c1_g1~~TRINITY_DN5303_c1_g1_i1.p1  ORF type:complete len:159 (+),score=23.87 TRINITY_DN5303_c1_g1_i1:88-564(+)